MTSSSYTVPLKTPISNDLSYTSSFNSTGGINYAMVAATQCNLNMATDPLVLKSGDTMLLYIVNPDSVSMNDVGLTVGISIVSAQAVYTVETNVQALSSS